jgi:hypothetical protein
MDDAPVLLCVTLSLMPMPTLLSKGDESAMNFEAVDVSFSAFFS